MAILVATLLALALAIVAKDAHLFDGVEDQTVAMRFQARGAHTPSNVAVIAIDDVTFSDLERQWPFPRSLHARAIDALRKAGARRIVYDVQFTEPTTEREDLALFNADPARRRRRARHHGDRRPRRHQRARRRRERARRRRPRRGGEPRDRPRRRHPSLPAHLGRPAQRRGRRPAGHRAPGRTRFGDKGAWIDYAGPRGTVPTYHFSDLIHGRVDPAKLRGRVVVVGATAPDAAGRPLHPDRQRPPDVGPGDPGQRDLDRAARPAAARGAGLDRRAGAAAARHAARARPPAHARAQGRRRLPARRAGVRGRRAGRLRQGLDRDRDLPAARARARHAQHHDHRVRGRAARAPPRRRAQRRARGARARAHRAAARDAARDRAAPQPGGGVARRRHRRAHPAHPPHDPQARARDRRCPRTRPS